LPEQFLAQLKPNGRVFAIVGDAPVMTARVIEWTMPGSRVTTDLFETVVAPLHNAATPDRFTF
jgi:protein-L-isoaspartate(D-aspartate) O-methyltransferase